MQRRKILVVDDEPGFTRLLRLVLPGYEICEVNDAREALTAALKFRPDLILLDVVMPEEDGGEVAAALRKEPLFRRVPIVFVTAIVSPAELKNKETICGFPFLAKPVSREQLIECIDRHLD